MSSSNNTGRLAELIPNSALEVEARQAETILADLGDTHNLEIIEIMPHIQYLRLEGEYTQAEVAGCGYMIANALGRSFYEMDPLADRHRFWEDAFVPLQEVGIVLNADTYPLLETFIEDRVLHTFVATSDLRADLKDVASKLLKLRLARVYMTYGAMALGCMDNQDVYPYPELDIVEELRLFKRVADYVRLMLDDQKTYGSTRSEEEDV